VRELASGLLRGGAAPSVRPMTLARALPWLWAVEAVLLGVALAMTAWYAPVHAEMGVIQKIFYFHLGAAVNTFVACGVVFVAGVAYLWTRNPKWDALGDSAARMAVLLSLIVLLTGMIWAKQAWGLWWEWSPPLTLCLVLWLLYVAYLAMRAAIRSAVRRATVCAAYGVAAFLDVPLVYLSVQLLPKTHPTASGLTGEMAETALVWQVAIALLTALLIVTRYRVTMRGAERGGAS